MQNGDDAWRDGGVVMLHWSCYWALVRSREYKVAALKAMDRALSHWAAAGTN